MVRAARALTQLLRRRPFAGLLLLTLSALAAAAVAVNLWGYSCYHHAEAEVAQGRFDEAGRHVRSCLRVWPGSARAHLLAARVARLSADYPAAEEHLNACTRLQKTATEDTQLEWVLLRAQRGEVEDVLPGLWYAVQHEHPRKPAILEAVARGYMMQLNYRQALVCLNEWLRLEPDTARALDWRGWVLQALDRAADARADYERALQLEPDRSAARLRLVNLLLARKNSQDALPHLEHLARTRPDDPEVRLARARCHALRGETAEAVALLDGLLAERPDDPAALVVRGDVAIQEGRPAEAESILRRALASKPTDIEVLYTLYRSLQAQPGREEDAERCLARHDRVKKDLDRVNTLLKMEAEKASEDPAVACEIGTLLLRLDEDRVGLYWLYKALKVDPRHRPTHEALAAYYDRVQQPEKAAEHRRLAGGSPAHL
jgi:tetratricopeptide (TPR) repeat protein